jgi:ubiquinone/menaquinone biosynthesis C-methylase UbiE
MELVKNKSTDLVSPERIKEQYCNTRAADRYGGFFKGSPRLLRKDRREKRCIARALAQIPPGALVLDLPCGAGRMYPLLKELGLNVVSADSSEFMVNHARQEIEELPPSHNQQQDRFQVADIFQTGFANNQFDAVVCNRLFHHFPDPQIRQKALRELARICSGPIVVSFFSNVATDAWKYYYKKFIKRKSIRDRIPIFPPRFVNDIHQSGLKVEKWYFTRPLISMQWYVLLRHWN